MRNRGLSLSIEEVMVFSQLLIYDQNRTIEQLNAHPILEKLEPRVRNRVISSLLTPSKEVLELYNQIMGSPIIDELVEYILMLYQRILLEYDPQKILFVSILRSGFHLASLLRHVVDKIHKIDIEIVGIPSNYIDQIDASSFKDRINRSGKDVIFIDGWCSRGVTYTIIQKFWYNLFPNKKFKYVALSNLSLIENDDFICATEEDILIPWSVCQTDNLGISNYFLHPTSNTSCAFFIPKSKREIQDSGIFYREVVDDSIRRKDYLRNVIKQGRKKKGNDFSQSKSSERLVKIGINECLKSIDKNDSVELYISDKIDSFSSDILKRYAFVHSMHFQTTPEGNCFVVRKFNQ